MKIKWKKLIVCLVIVYSIAFIGSIFTSGNIDTEWYESIRVSLTPPSFIFPLVWNILFFLIALSLYLAWTNTEDKKTKKKIALVFGINFFLNILWSILFFSLKNLRLAFAELIILEFSIILMILTTRRINKLSSYLLIPYLIWVAFAGILNYLIIFK